MKEKKKKKRKVGIPHQQPFPRASLCLGLVVLALLAPECKML
jgi:hypothetical protein